MQGATVRRLEPVVLPYSPEELDPAYALGLLGWTQQPVYASGGPLLPRLLDLANVLLSGGRNTLNGEYYGFTPYLVHMPLPGELLLLTDVGGVLPGSCPLCRRPQRQTGSG